MVIVVDSTRGPKLNAVKDGVSEIAPLLGDRLSFEVVGHAVGSGVSCTPTSRQDVMRGARQRAEALQRRLSAEGQTADFYVGVEGGLDVIVDDAKKRVSSRVGHMFPTGNAGILAAAAALNCPKR